MTALLEESENPRTLIDDLLAEQQVLTAVQRFARKHERDAFPAQARYYRDLIPLTKPGTGEQYAFGVDLDACTGCKACVSACHSLNGLDEDEIWRDIGLLHGGSTAEPYQQTVTTACHHCVEPACLLGCPVKAYEKDAETGIVRHLDDQCIGCQYCVLKCPYDVPKYSEKRGIVRKCDMCHGRLSAGEAPACVQACPSGAITIRIVEKSSHAASLATGDRLLPGAFDSEYTKPTTAYTSSRPMPGNARPGDADALRLEHAHWPLIAMLVLTQIAVGIYLSAATLALGEADGFESAQVPLAVVAFIILNLGLAVSVLHLGRPLGAWRAFLGLRTSWMSREILAFTIFAASAGAFIGAALWKTLIANIPALSLVERFIAPSEWVVPLAIVTAGLGLVGVFCSAMIYVDTRRVFWRSEQTFIKFFGTTVLLGSASAAVVLRWTDALTAATPIPAATILTFVATLTQAALFSWELQNLHRSLHDESDADHRSALVIWKLRRSLLMVRCAIFAGAMFCGILANTDTGWNGAVSATFAFLLTLGSQFIERYFFFTAVVAPRMPGPLSSSSPIRA